jgi:metallo-beta-lactamase family protein
MDRTALTFLGGVGTVTGSKHLIDTGTSQVLLDCGLFHGLSSLRRRNWQPPPPFDWKSFDEVVLTHAHLDHSGYLPMLARHGWRVRCMSPKGRPGWSRSCCWTVRIC